jgi:NADH-quinone oxidoreductase subunit H
MFDRIDYIDIIIMVVKIIVLMLLLVLAAAYMTFIERKVVAKVQIRVGPNRCGPFGLVQPIADAVKLMLKEDIIPRDADRLLFILAPFLLVATAMIALAVIPFGGTVMIGGRVIMLGISDVNVGVLVFLALSSLAVYGIVFAGWSSKSKYSLLGGMRSAAQMISYEISMSLAIAAIVIWAGSLSLTDIVKAQMNIRPAQILDWTLMPIPHLIALAIFTITILAETNRAPFDLPECENELVGGYHTEYSGLRWAMFFLGEYANMIVGSALLVTLFLGGWMFPFGLSNSGILASPIAGPIIGIIWFAFKVAVVLFIFIWFRATFPRLRYDQLMAFGWKFLLPVALGNLFLMAFVKMLVSS